MPASRAFFLRGRPARRSRPRQRGWLGRLGSFAAAVGLLTLVVLGGVQILSTLAESNHFRVRTVAFSRASESVRGRLRARLEGMLGANLFEVDLADAVRRLERDPWVRRAVIKRWLPGTLQVSVEERRPAALGLFRGRTVVVDSEGWPIEEAREPWPKMPRLTGIAARLPESFAREAASGLAALSRVARGAPALLEGLQEVDLSVPGAVVLRRGQDNSEVWLDRADAGRNLGNYLRVRSVIERRFGEVAAIDLRWRDQIALRPLHGGGTGE